MNHNKDVIVISHIIDYCDDVMNTVHRFNGTRNLLEEDRIFRNACSMPLMQIGELAKKLSSETVDIDKTIPWKNIKGMRTFFAHEYNEIDTEVVWNTIMEISSFKNKCLKLKNRLVRLSKGKSFSR